jgi:single-strand DNA-binding protein
MISLNKITLIGDLGADPESRAMPSGGTVCTIRLATTEKWKDKTSGEKMEHTEWHRVVFFGRSADVCMQYLSKGDTIYVEGSNRTNKYTDKQGVERYSTEVRGSDTQFVKTKGRENGSTGATTASSDSETAGREPTQAGRARRF